MTKRHFEIFTTVCRFMNMTAAAKALYISQSAVSQAILDMENHYSVRLFERFQRKLYITDAGEQLLGYAKHMLNLYQNIEDDMKRYELSATLRVGASVTVATAILPKLIKGFKADYPTAHLVTTEDNTSHIEALLLNADLDIGIVEGDLTSPDLDEIELMHDPLIFICRPDHAFAGAIDVSPLLLKKENFILREIGSGTRKTFEAIMLDHNIEWHSDWTCNNADTIKEVVLEGLGITVISKRAVQELLDTDRLKSFTVAGIRFNRTFRIVYHKHKYMTPSLKAFIQYAQTKNA